MSGGRSSLPPRVRIGSAMSRGLMLVRWGDSRALGDFTEYGRPLVGRATAEGAHHADGLIHHGVRGDGLLQLVGLFPQFGDLSHDLHGLRDLLRTARPHRAHGGSNRSAEHARLTVPARVCREPHGPVSRCPRSRGSFIGRGADRRTAHRADGGRPTRARAHATIQGRKELTALYGDASCGVPGVGPGSGRAGKGRAA